MSSTAKQLRESFDAAFATPLALTTESVEDVLAVRVGGNPYALRLSQIVGLHADRKVVPVPGPVAELLGVAGIRGLIVPVYDLAPLLGYLPASRPRWFVIAQAPQPVGLAFEMYEAHVRLPRAAFADGAVQAGGVLRPLIPLIAVLETIGKRIGAQAPSGETQ